MAKISDEAYANNPWKSMQKIHEVSWSCCATKPKGHDKVENNCSRRVFFEWTTPNSLEHEDRSGWQRGKTRLQWQMWLYTQRIGKDIRASSYFFIRRAADVVSEACFTMMTGDRHDGQAAMDFSMIIFAQTPSWLEWILTVMPVWLYFSSFLFSSVLFLNTELYILYACYLCLILISVRKLAI